jgi:hypothetical protein
MVPDASVVSIVDIDLLEQARAHGVDDPALADGVARAIDALAGGGATAIVCTCSTIGGLAERIGRERSLPVVRVDRPMAERAVELGGRIVVVAALASTITPTTDLLAEVAVRSGTEVDVEALLVEVAWPRFEGGDLEAYHRTIADAVIACATGSSPPDVIVLAQASMAPVADLAEVLALSVPVLASPRIAVQSLRPR